MAFSVRDMVFTALFAAILCAVAPFSLYIGPIPFSFATFIIYLAAATLGWKRGSIAVALYVLLGAVGLPVFSGFRGGFHVIAGATGGYIIGYIPIALVTGAFAELFKKKVWLCAVGMVIGTILLYTLGTAWFMFQSGNPFAASLALCVTPFLPGDAAKIAAACVIAPQLRAAIGRLRPQGV